MFGWRRKAKTLGRRGEDLAAKALKRAGYSILERNAHLGRYEIDIIAREDDTVAFVEVKTRRNADIALPEENVHAEKQRRLGRAARVYMDCEDDPEMYYRFDVVSVLLPEEGKPDITIYRDAFRHR